MSSLRLNGKEEPLNAAVAITDFLQSKDIEIDRVVVEINREIIKKEDYGSRKISPGDTVELISFVGGG